jgi:hypothetical protein
MCDEKHPIWEETWDTCDGVISIQQKTKYYVSVDGRFPWEQEPNVGAFGDLSGASPFNPDVRDDARAKMASVAPEAIRALKSIEWAGKTDDTGWACCLFCGGQKEGPGCRLVPDSKRTCEFDVVDCVTPHGLVGHYPTCEYVRLMTKADCAELIDAGTCD